MSRFQKKRSCRLVGESATDEFIVIASSASTTARREKFVDARRDKRKKIATARPLSYRLCHVISHVDRDRDGRGRAM